MYKGKHLSSSTREMQERSHHSKLKKIPVGAGASNTELDRVQVLHLTTEVAQERHLSSSPKEVPVVLSGYTLLASLEKIPRMAGG